jgi:hypothetical protein
LGVKEAGLGEFGAGFIEGEGFVVGEDFGPEFCAHGEGGGVGGLAVEEEGDERSHGADIDEGGGLGEVGLGELVGGDEGIGGGGDFAEVEVTEAAAADLVLDFAFLAERDPEGIGVVGEGVEGGEVVDDGAFAEAAEFTGFLGDGVLDVFGFGGGEVEDLGEGAVVGEGEGDGAIADLVEEGADAEEAIFARVVVFAGGFEEFLLEDAGTAEEFFDEDNFDGARAGVDGEESTGRQDTGQEAEWGWAWGSGHGGG